MEQVFGKIRQTNIVLSKSMLMMGFGVLVTALISFFTYKSGLVFYVASGITSLILGIIQIALVIIFSANYAKLSPTMSKLLFYIYAILNGVTLSYIYLIYNVGTIVWTFFLTSILFFALAFIGYTTDTNLTKAGPYLIAFLIGGSILTLLNIFLFKSSTLSIILDLVLLCVFCGVTIYDVSNIARFEQTLPYSDDKIYSFFALSLYLDFINIFLRLLRLVGRTKRN